MKVYDLETFSWEYYPLMDNDHNYGINEYADLFAHEGYIYLSIKRRRNKEGTNTVLSWQCLYRFNVNTHRWEQLKNIADNAEDCMNIDAVWFDGQQLYVHSDKPFYGNIILQQIVGKRLTYISLPTSCIQASIMVTSTIKQKISIFTASRKNNRKK